MTRRHIFGNKFILAKAPVVHLYQRKYAVSSHTKHIILIISLKRVYIAACLCCQVNFQSRAGKTQVAEVQPVVNTNDPRTQLDNECYQELYTQALELGEGNNQHM